MQQKRNEFIFKLISFFIIKENYRNAGRKKEHYYD